MKKNLKLKILLNLIWLTLLLPIKTFGYEYEGDIVGAINHLEETVLSALQGNSANSMVNQFTGLKAQLAKTFDEAFKGDFDSTTKKVKGSSALDQKIDLYVQNFYSWYTTKTFANSDLSSKNKTANDSTQKLLLKELGYSTQLDIEKQLQDTNALLAMPIETGANNISRESLGVPKDKQDIAAYGSLSAEAPEAKDAPTISDLINPDGYIVDKNQNQQNKALLFMSYLLQTVPPPKNFYIPDKKDAYDNKVNLYLPVESQDAPYTTVSISTKQNLDDVNKGSEYDQMVKFLSNNAKYWQKYKMKTRATNILRTLYLEALFRTYQDRVKDSSDNQSLVEKEKEMAFAILDKKYYEELKKKTVADINLETLYAINKLVYFLYKLHQDNERLSMLLATSGMQLTAQDSQDENNYINPIATLIQNKCWESNKSDQEKQICDNPLTSAKPIVK